MRDYMQSMYNAYGSGPSQPGLLSGKIGAKKKGHKHRAKTPAPTESAATSSTVVEKRKELATKHKKGDKKHKKGANPPTQGGKSPKAQEKQKEKQKAKIIGRKIRDPTLYRPVKDWETHTKEHTEKRLDKDGNEIQHRFRPGTVALQSGYIVTVFISISIIYPGFVRSSGCRGALVYWTGAVL